MRGLILAVKRGLLLGCALSLFSVATPVLSAAEGSGHSVSQSGGGGWLWELLNHWFGRVDDDEDEEPSTGKGSRPINNGNPVPTIENDDDSAAFIKQRIADEALTDHPDDKFLPLQLGVECATRGQWELTAKYMLEARRRRPDHAHRLTLGHLQIHPFEHMDL